MYVNILRLSVEQKIPNDASYIGQPRVEWAFGGDCDCSCDKNIQYKRSYFA